MSPGKIVDFQAVQDVETYTVTLYVLDESGAMFWIEPHADDREWVKV